MASHHLEATTPAPRSLPVLISDKPVRNTSVLAYTNAFTLWHYRVAKVRDAVAPGHFDWAAPMMAVGDQMHVTAEDGAALLYVRSVDGERVTVAWLALAEHPSGSEG